MIFFLHTGPCLFLLPCWAWVNECTAQRRQQEKATLSWSDTNSFWYKDLWWDDVTHRSVIFGLLLELLSVSFTWTAVVIWMNNEANAWIKSSERKPVAGKDIFPSRVLNFKRQIQLCSDLQRTTRKNKRFIHAQKLLHGERKQTHIWRNIADGHPFHLKTFTMDKYPQIIQSGPCFICIFHRVKTLNSEASVHPTQQGCTALWRGKQSFSPESVLPLALRVSLVGFEQWNTAASDCNTHQVVSRADHSKQSWGICQLDA